MQYCSLQHWTLLLSSVPSTTGCCSCFGSIPSFFLELFLHWSPVAYWAPTDLGSPSFSILSFCLLILFMGFSRHNTEVVCHSLLQWTTFCQTSPPWPDHLGWPHMAWLSFIELDKAVVLWSDWLGFCDYGFGVSALWCPLTTPTILLGFLLPWTWDISSRLLLTINCYRYLKTSDRYPCRLPKEGRLGVLKWAGAGDRQLAQAGRETGGLPTSLVVLCVSVMCPSFVPSTSQEVVGFGPFVSNCTCM